MLLPFAVVFVVFVLWPLGSSFFLSLTSFSGLGVPEFLGIENYVALVSDTRFHRALLNTSVYVVLTVTITTVLAYLFALAFHTARLRDKIVRTVLFLPSVTSGIALILVWRWIFSAQDFGLANTLSKAFGAGVHEWLAEPAWSVPIMIAIAVFGGLGYNTIILAAGITNVPAEYEEAAEVDGANYWQRVRHIIIPQTMPIVAFVVVTMSIASFQVFELAYLLFGYGVQDSALTVVSYLYERGFNRFQLGYASAISWVLFAIIFVVGLVQLRLTRASKEF
jgi:multiple sugar transport system permease protein